MARPFLLLSSVALVATLLGACSIQGEASCSCAAGVTFEGTFYGQYSDVTVPVDAQIGKSDEVAGCCGDAETVEAVYSIDGLDPQLAIATKHSDGTTTFNVAFDLTPRQSKVVEQFAQDDRDPSRQ